MDPPNRFEGLSLTVLPEAAEAVTRQHPAGVQRPTRVYRDRTRRIINHVDSPDLPFSWTLNPYRGCEHGCPYCYARPTHEQLGFSCGLDFETRIVAKPDAPELLRRELDSPRWAGEPIVMSGVTDPYQPIERRMKITRGCLAVMAEYRQPVTIVTKSGLVTRDADHLAELARHGAAAVAVSVTTLDPTLSALMEPRASRPLDRLRAVRELSRAGVPVHVMVAPMIPGLNDREIPAILEASARAGARSASWVLLRLPHQVKTIFLDWLRMNLPDRAARVEGLLRQLRDGRLNDSRFGDRMRGRGPLAAQIAETFRVFASRYGLAGPIPTPSPAAFRRPGDLEQPGLFDQLEQTAA